MAVKDKHYDLLKQLGITPQTHTGPTSASGVQRVTPTPKPQKVSQGNISPTTGSVQPVRVSPVPVVHSLISQAKDDSAWGTVGHLFGKAIEVVDTPRAWGTSAVKEAADFLTYDTPIGRWVGDLPGVTDLKDTKEAPQHGSFSELASQAKRHMGFQEVLDKNTNMPGGWQRSALGFAGDVATDPLTYASLGAAGGSAEIASALKAGGRKEISEAVARAGADVAANAGEDFTKGKAAIDALTANAGRSGRGALTAKGLEKAGVDSALAEKLGLPKLQYELAGLKVPGGGKAAEAVANLKGEIKAAFGGTKAANYLRSLRIPENGGVLKLTNIIRASDGDPEMQAKAVKVLMNVTQGTAESRKWADVEIRSLLKSDLAKTMRHDTGALVRDSEATDTRTALNDWLDTIHAKLVEKGVDVPYRENYVPHIVTQEARAAARKDETVRAFIDSIDKKEGFQQARTATGTIAEENARFAAAHPGIKLFEDDAPSIAMGYLHQAEHAVNRSTIQRGLDEMGVSGEIPMAESKLGMKQKITQEHVDAGVATSDQIGKTLQQGVDEAKKTLTKTAKEADKAQRQGLTLKEKAASVASAALKDQKGTALKRIDEIDKQVKDLAARKAGAEADVTLAEAKLASAQKNADGWKAIASRSRGRAKADAYNKMRNAEAHLAKVTEDHNAAQAALKLVTDGDRGGARSFAHEINALNEERNGLTADYVSATADHEALKQSVVPLGAAQTLGEAQLQEANTKVAELGAKVGRARTDADIVGHVYDMVLADREAVKPIVDEEIAAIDDALRKAPRSKNPKTVKAMTNYGADLSENLRVANEILAHAGNDPVTHILANFEATAAVADARAARLGYAADMINDSIRTTYDPKFRTYLRQTVDDGFQRLNETHQIPDWVDNALKANKILADDTAWNEWTKAYDKGLNVLKGYMVARPGFIVRNTYSSLFNVYLEGGARAMKSIGEYMPFYKMLKEDPENYLARATEKYGADKADMLDRAFKAQAATGYGQAADEFHIGAMAGLSANPLSPNFAPIRAVRQGNQAIEEVIRGAHAFDVLKRGGSDSLALDTIEKWHFNYRDITSFDRKMKRIMPFWSFFSNNVALQAQTFPQILPKLNRTYFNVKRNSEYGKTPDTNVPDYFKSSMPMRLSGGGDPGSSVKYLFPDLPAIKAVEEANSAVSSKGLSLVAQMNPLIKIGNDAILGDKNSFTGNAFTDKYSPTPIPLPQFLPGVDKGGNSGKSVWTDRTKYAYESLLPQMSQADRFGSGHNQMDSLMSFLGVSTRTNNDKTRKGEQLRRERVQKAELDRIKNLGRV